MKRKRRQKKKIEVKKEPVKHEEGPEEIGFFGLFDDPVIEQEKNENSKIIEKPIQQKKRYEKRGKEK